MRTPASVARHPIHPMLVPIPIGLWIFSFVCDLFFRVSEGASPNWEIVAFYTMIGGTIGALIAAIPGFIDMLSLRRDIKDIALIHMALNLTVVVLFVINVWLRYRHGFSDSTFWLSAVAIAMLGVSGWLGGKMVYNRGVGVDVSDSKKP